MSWVIELFKLSKDSKWIRGYLTFGGIVFVLVIIGCLCKGYDIDVFHLFSAKQPSKPDTTVKAPISVVVDKSTHKTDNSVHINKSKTTSVNQSNKYGDNIAGDKNVKQ